MTQAKPARSHLWRGRKIDDASLTRHIEHLRLDVEAAMGHGLEIETVLRAAEAFAAEIRGNAASLNPLRRELATVLGDDNAVTEGLAELAGFMQRSSLETKLLRELGTTDPFTPRRYDYHHPRFESWAPLGLLVHIAPGNAFAVGVLSVIEGLLAGNVNLLKLSSADSDFPLLFLERLATLDPTETLHDFIFALKISSSETILMEKILGDAAGIAAWGGEEAIAGIRKIAPKGARVVDWGHRLSFAYISAGILQNNPESVIDQLAAEVCLLEQQACSSPQCIYLDVDAHTSVGEQILTSFAKNLADAIAKESKRLGPPEIERAESAEIAMVTSVQRCEAALGLGSVIEADDKSWRVLVDTRSALRASPLYRSVWVKPLLRDKIFQTLWPMREFLQTAGVACNADELADLSAKLIASGILRMTEIGQMLGSYDGEPHDGVYALTRYARRISYQLPTIGARFVSFSDLTKLSVQPPWNPKDPPPQIMGKEEFQAQEIRSEDAELFFKSGGSSGEPKISVFTYRDYHTQMELAAEGLVAAGFDPNRDRCMNLFFGGGLYGGFLSFFTILEHLKAVQFPMSAHLELGFVVDMILRYNVNTVLGMPSYLNQLFHAPENIDRLRKYKPIKKILFGGEHFSSQQREQFQKDFGVELIRSATYGSVDSGPLGYQCEASDGTIHHLHHRLQMLEILDLHEDKPVSRGDNHSDVGRLVFTSLVRHGQKLYRYDIGDLGRWIYGRCDCGRQSPRFELMGRYGDIFRAAGSFFNFQKIANIIRDSSGYSGELQLIIDHQTLTRRTESVIKDRLQVVADPSAAHQLASIRRQILDQYMDMRELVVLEETLQLEVTVAPIESFQRTPGSGKLRRVIDNR